MEGYSGGFDVSRPRFWECDRIWVDAPVRLEVLSGIWARAYRTPVCPVWSLRGWELIESSTQG